jgi:hypothetical protein
LRKLPAGLAKTASRPCENCQQARGRVTTEQNRTEHRVLIRVKGAN